MMKVGSLVVTTEYEDEKRGGLGTYTDMIIRYLKRRFEKICVIEIPMRNDGYFSLEEPDEGELVATIPFPSFKKRQRGDYGLYIDNLIEEVEIKNGCVALGNDWFGGYVSELVKKKTEKDVKSVFIPHIFSSLIKLKGYDGHNFEEMIRRADKYTYQKESHNLEADLIESSDVTLFISEYMKEFAERRVRVPEKSAIIKHYVEYIPTTKVSYNDKIEDVVFAGRFVEQKGVLDIAEHMGDILEVLPESRFHFYGKGGMGSVLRWATRRFGDRVQIHGFVPREELLCLLPDMDLLVMPSIFEPFGFSALEAMATGVPIAATDTGGLGELTSWLPEGLQFQRSFGTNPLYRSPENVGAYIPREELLRVFRFAAENPDVLRRVGHKGRRIAREQYTRQRFEYEMDNFLDTVDALLVEAN